MSRELDPDSLFREIDSKQEKEEKSISYMLDEREERRMKHNYKVIAKTLIHKFPPEFDNNLVKKMLDLKSMTNFYILKIEKAINDEGYELLKLGGGRYEIKINEETKEVLEFIDSEKERVESVEVVKEEVETKTVEEEVEAEEFMMQEGQVIDPMFLKLKDAIKEPEKLIEMNSFFIKSGIGLAFVIKDIELIEVEVKKPQPAGQNIGKSIEPAGGIMKHTQVAIVADSVQFKNDSTFMEKFKTGEYKTLTCIRCSICGQIFYSKISYGEIINCGCGAMLDSSKIDLFHTHYDCPNCEARPQMITDLRVKEVSCVSCRGPIDLSDPDKHGTRYNISKLTTY